MKSNDISACFISDSNKIKLSAGDLFDRIINVKLTCQSKVTGLEEVFVIRSDYELIYTNQSFDSEQAIYGIAGTYIIRRCTKKPSIKVHCKMVTSNTGTSVTVQVANFYMLSKDGKHLRSFNESDYVLCKVEVTMGYWGQFNGVLSNRSTILDYFNIEPVNGADKITLTAPIVVTTDKLPPDSTLQLQGFVGEIYSSPVGITTISDASTALSKPTASSGTGLAKIFYENITRRYINKHIVGAKQEEILLASLDPQTKQLPQTLADNYGVHCYLSEGAEALEIGKLIDSEGNEVARTVYFEAGWTIGQTITRIIENLNVNLEYCFANNGAVLIYTPGEANNPSKLNSKFSKDGLYKDTVLANAKLYNNKLPAVYNINIDTVATITCPFFTFIQPFQHIEFASRYALTSMVSYFASYAPTINKFLVINATISFATEEDVNEVSITAVSETTKR